MTMSASLSIVGNPIENQPSTCVLTVSNSGVANVNVTGISPRMDRQSGHRPVKFGEVFAAPGFSLSTSNSINQMSVSVAAGGSTVFSFSVIAFGGAVGTGLPVQPENLFYITADVVSDDGSEFSAPAQAYAPANPQFGQPPGSPPNANPAVFGGELQFNQASNSALAF